MTLAANWDRLPPGGNVYVGLKAALYEIRTRIMTEAEQAYRLQYGTGLAVSAQEAIATETLRVTDTEDVAAEVEQPSAVGEPARIRGQIAEATQQEPAEEPYRPQILFLDKTAHNLIAAWWREDDEVAVGALADRLLELPAAEIVRVLLRFQRALLDSPIFRRMGMTARQIKDEMRRIWDVAITPAN